MRLPIYFSIALFVFTIISLFVLIHEKIDTQNTYLTSNTSQLASVSAQLAALEAQDQLLINKALKNDIDSTRSVFLKANKVYEKLIDYQLSIKKSSFEKEFAGILADLSDLKYASAEAKLAKLSTEIDEAKTANQAKSLDISALPLENSPPGSGYRRQKVTVAGAEVAVDIIAADLSSTRVIVDTASDSTCTDNCPVLPLATYVTRNNAYAAINGTYFCPASYPSCAGKTNSFDVLVMNKNKVYFNSDNNVYSSNPAVIFQGSSVRFVTKTAEWGRDTGIDSMLSNYPLLVWNSKSQFGGDDDPKKSGLGNRSFIASKGSVVYIGVVRGVSVAGAGQVLETLGMEYALNLDSGGSTALWANGSYKAGPGRDIPNAILFVRK